MLRTVHAVTLNAGLRGAVRLMAMREERAGKRQRGNEDGGPGGEDPAELHSPTVQVLLLSETKVCALGRSTPAVHTANGCSCMHQHCSVRIHSDVPPAGVAEKWLYDA